MVKNALKQYSVNIEDTKMEEFLVALNLLNSKLALGNLNIRIRAVGGFALLCHGIRKNKVTCDIDTVTDDYEKDQLRLINEVANELNISNDWLNNYNASESADVINHIIQADWVNSHTLPSFSNIDIKIASSATLLRSKLLAYQDYEQNRRKKDLTDIVKLCRNLNIKTKYDIIRFIDGFVEIEDKKIDVIIGILSMYK